MAKQRSGFMEGCAANGSDKELAGTIFDLVEMTTAEGVGVYFDIANDMSIGSDPHPPAEKISYACDQPSGVRT